MAEIHIAKHRNGALGVVTLKYIAHLAKFANIDTILPYHSESKLAPNKEFENDNGTIIRGSRMNDHVTDEFNPENVPF